jgi:hypothetical protein
MVAAQEVPRDGRTQTGVLCLGAPRLNIGTKRVFQARKGPSILLRSLRTRTEEASRGSQASPCVRPVGSTGG